MRVEAFVNLLFAVTDVPVRRPALAHGTSPFESRTTRIAKDLQLRATLMSVNPDVNQLTGSQRPPNQEEN